MFKMGAGLVMRDTEDLDFWGWKPGMPGSTHHKHMKESTEDWDLPGRHGGDL